MTENAKIQAEVALNADPAVQGFKKLEAAGAAASKSIEESGKKAEKALANVGTAAEESAKKQQSVDSRIEASLKRRIALTEAAVKGERALDEARISNRGADPQKFSGLLDELERARQKNDAYVKSLVVGNSTLNAYGQTARQTAAALRTVPAQFTDIITSLQGGQAPLTVLLQQGGQLKDVFGGVGNAARALGGYVLGLVNPYTIAAAAIGGIALAFEKGAQEQREFQKTLILTGNAAGVTAGQLSEAAARIDQFSGATQGKAAEALNIFTNAGIKGIDTLERYTATAIEFERAGGGAIEKVAENFAKLGKDPLKASLELNDSMNFLTRSLYEQIKALEDQGRSTEAARVAQEAYNASLNDRTPQLLQNLGYIERGWKAITDATKAASDAALNVGRADPLGDAKSAFATSQARLERLRGLGPGVDTQRAIASELSRGEASKQELLNLQEVERFQRKIVGLKSEQAATVKAQVEYDKIRDQYLDKRLQREREIAKVTEAAQQAGKPVDDFVIAGINKKYEEKAPSGVADLNRGISAQIEALKQGAAIKAEIARQEADTRSSEFKRGIINVLQFIEQEKQANLDSLNSRKSILQEELRLATGKKGSQVEQARLAGQIALNEQEAAMVIIKAQNDIAEAKFKQARASEAVYQAQRDEDLAAQTAFMLANASARNAGEKAVRDYAKSIQESIDFTKFEIGLMGQSDQARAVAIEQYKIQIELKKQLEAINSNTGFDSADRAAQTAAATAAAATASAAASSKAFLDEWKKTTDTISSSLTDALLRGFESGKGFGDNLKDTFKSLSKTLVLKPIIEMPVKQAAAALAPLQQKFTEFIAAQILGNQQVAASATAGAAASVAASQASGQAAATAGIANQANGDPYSAFFRIAAMTAIMAALGYAVKGGGSGAAPVTNQGTGTVFGDATAKSASIDNSLKILETSRIGLRYSAQMANSLKNIESAFAGVTNLVLRNGEIGNLERSVQTGNLQTGLSRTIASLNPVGGILGGFVNNLAAKVFGKKVSIQGSGITGGPQSLGDIESLGFQGNYYADIQTKRKFLGITTSTRNSTQLSELDAELADQFTKIFVGIGDSVTAAAGALGIRTETVQEALSKYIVDIGKIDLKGLSGKEIQEKLSAVFGAESDKIAAAVIPGFERIQKVGEGYFETLVRAATQLESVNTTFSLLGGSLSLVSKNADTFLEKISGGFRTAPGVDRAIVADQLVQQFGGLEQFNEATNSFYEAFYSRGERAQNTLRLLGTSLEGIDATLPTSISAWRDLTTSLDITTEAGRQAFETLITLGPTFAELQEQLLSDAGISGSAIADVLRDGMLARITQAEIGQQLSSIIVDGIYNSLANGFAEQISNTFTNQIIAPLLQSVATGGVLSASISQASIDTVVATATNAANQLAAILGDQGFQAAIAGVQAAISGIAGAFPGKSATAATAVAAQSYSSLGSAVNSASNAADKGADAWKSIGDSITNEIDRIRGVLTGGDKASALASFATITAQTRAGDQEAAKLLPNASQAYIKAVEETAGSLLEVKRAQGFALSSLLETRSIIGQGPAAMSPTSFTPSFTPSYSTGGATQNNDALIAEVKLLRAEVAALKPYAQTTAEVLDKAAKAGDGSGAFGVEVQT